MRFGIVDGVRSVGAALLAWVVLSLLMELNPSSGSRAEGIVVIASSLALGALVAGRALVRGPRSG
jgi:hypothetical protein